MLDQFESARLIWTVSIKWRAKADGTLLERPRGRRDEFLSAESLLRDKQLFSRGLISLQKRFNTFIFHCSERKISSLIRLPGKEKKLFSVY